MTATITIGKCEIEINWVKCDYINKEDGGDFLLGKANVTWTGSRGGCSYSHDAEIKVGCWADTDDDNCEWAAWHEGAHAIEKCLGGTGEGDPRGTMVALAFADECESLGLDICELLRESAGNQKETAYPT